MKKFACILLGVIFIAAGMTTAVFAGEQFAAEWVPEATTQATAKYWTKERMRNAKPYPLPTLKGTPSTLPAWMIEQPSEPPGSDPGSKPSVSDPGSKGGNTSALFSEDGGMPLFFREPSELPGEEGSLGGETAMANGYDYPPPHTTFRVLSSLYGTSSTIFPYMCIGKVFFTEAGTNYVCSGSSIGGRAVLTAGHCVSDGKGHWRTNWSFVPAYKNGATPYGKWSAFWKTTFSTWHKNGDFSRDVGFATVKDIGGKKLSQKVGYLGFAWNQSRILHWNTFGYPSGSPYDGQYMVETQASYAGVDTSKNPYTTGIGTSQTQGQSGGPWIKTFVPGQAGAMDYANGVNSYNYSTSQPLMIYTPYFDSKVKSLKDKAVAK
jgi:V8-like Glu-specific endopeptidase